MLHPLITTFETPVGCNPTGGQRPQVVRQVQGRIGQQLNALACADSVLDSDR